MQRNPWSKTTSGLGRSPHFICFLLFFWNLSFHKGLCRLTSTILTFVCSDSMHWFWPWMKQSYRLVCSSSRSVLEQICQYQPHLFFWPCISSSFFITIFCFFQYGYTLTCRAWDVHTFLLMVGNIQFEHTDELNKRRKIAFSGLWVCMSSHGL